MLATDKLLEIEQTWGDRVQRIVPIELDGGTLRITEQWQGQRLLRYSYYWLTQANELQVGWDNVPHHTHLASFPHHKHIGSQDNPQPAFETTLDQVLAVVLGD